MRRVFDAKDQYPSQWAAIESIAGKIGCTGETLHKTNEFLRLAGAFFAQAELDRCLKS